MWLWRYRDLMTRSESSLWLLRVVWSTGNRKWILLTAWMSLEEKPNLQIRITNQIKSCWVAKHVWLCDPMECSLPGSSVHGILQARILEWVAIFSSRGSSQLRDGTHVSCISCIDSSILYHGPPRILVSGGNTTREGKVIA